ncbi:hypothetical protein BDV06DRAFT_41935 [Aspergillus oleicola]
MLNIHNVIHQLIVPASQTLELLCRTYSESRPSLHLVTISSTDSYISPDKRKAHMRNRLYCSCSIVHRQISLVFRILSPVPRTGFLYRSGSGHQTKTPREYCVPEQCL